MTRPLMDSDPTRVSPERGRPGGAAQVTLGTDLADARTLLEKAGGAAAVVLDGDRPVGIVSAAALRRPVEGDRPTTVADVMDYQAVHVSPGADELTTVSTFRRAAWASLLRRPRHGRP